MNTNLVRASHFIVRHGKLVPRPTTPPHPQKNYRYVPFDPVNNPGPDDYFRETIARLQQENAFLKKELEFSRGPALANSKCDCATREDQLNLEISQLRHELCKLREELAHRYEMLAHKDKQVLDMSNENTRLRLRADIFTQELTSLHQILDHKDQELESKNEAIRNYCRTIEELARKDQEDQRTTQNSEYYFSTPRIDEKDEEYEEEDDEREFYSVDCKSFRAGASSNYLSRTPDNYSFKSFDDFTDDYNYHSAEPRLSHTEADEADAKKIQKTQDEEEKANTPLCSPSSARSLLRSSSNDNKSNLSANLMTWGEWASRSPNIMTLDLIEDSVDPLTSGFLSVLHRH